MSPFLTVQTQRIRFLNHVTFCSHTDSLYVRRVYGVSHDEYYLLGSLVDLFCLWFLFTRFQYFFVKDLFPYIFRLFVRYKLELLSVSLRLSL